MVQKRFLIARTDRLGDALLTLPVARELKRAFPESSVTALFRRYTQPLAQLCECIDEVLCDDVFKPGFFSKKLTDELRRGSYDCAFIAHPAPRVLLSSYFAGIPKRVGRASNVFQFLLSDKRHQKRSQNKQHEYMYNLDLLEGTVEQIDRTPMRLKLTPSLEEYALKMRKSLGFNPANTVIIHPGHGGSALNLSPRAYAEIASALNPDMTVLVSVGPGETSVKSSFEPNKNLIFAENIPDAAHLAAVFSDCLAFVGGSTGPMHLAAALGIPCHVFFPPVKAMTPVRWGPQSEKSRVYMPELEACDGLCDKCPDNGCMDTIDLNKIIPIIKEEAGKRASSLS